MVRQTARDYPGYPSLSLAPGYRPNTVSGCTTVYSSLTVTHASCLIDNSFLQKMSVHGQPDAASLDKDSMKNPPARRVNLLQLNGLWCQHVKEGVTG